MTCCIVVMVQQKHNENTLTHLWVLWLTMLSIHNNTMVCDRHLFPRPSTTQFVHTTDEYDDCSGKYKVDLSTTVTAMELALYKQAGRDSNQYYVIVKYGAKIATMYVPGSAGPGWQVVPLQGAVSEVVGGALDILVTVYTSASGFLSCAQVKSLFTVTSPGNTSPGNTSPGNTSPGNTSPVLSVYTNASGSGGGLTYDVQSAGLNHSYVAVMNGTKSECATKATAMICYSNVSLSFKTSDKGNYLFIFKI